MTIQVKADTTSQAGRSQQPIMRKGLWVILAVIVLAAIIGGTAVRRSRVEAAQNKKADAAASQRAIPVMAAQVATRDMPVYLRGLGTVIAFNTVTVK